MWLVDPFDSSGTEVAGREDARRFLLQRTDGVRRQSPDDPEQAMALAQDVGRLIVPLDHAACLIAHAGMSFGAYRAAWAEASERVRDRFQPGVSLHTRMMTPTWLVTYEALDAEARTLLAVLSFFSPAPVPCAVFVALGESLAAAYRARLDTLAAVGFVRIAPDGADFRVQGLVQRLTRHTIGAEQVRANLTAALVWMDFAFAGAVDSPDLRSRFEPLVPHVEQIVAAGESGAIASPTATLMRALGRFHAALGGQNVAASWLARAQALEG
ncbi:MAG TPA: hypothetical protein PK812_08625 [Beijerinckiaceae bacterium]|nr:hypothetical protein [Beijerinckiaceae bacterium]